MPSKLARRFYAAPTLSVAKQLLGKRLVRRHRGQRLSGIIVETEAYLGADDSASHARHGPASRAAPMFGPPGQAYVYFTYGMYYCLNAVTEPTGSGTGVLIRAIEPVEGIATMQRRRGRNVTGRNLTNGPGKLCQALGIDTGLNQTDLLGQQLWLEEGQSVPPRQIGRTARVGIRHGREHQARFFIKQNPFVSAHPRY